MGIFGGILLGILAGFVGFLPLFGALRLSRRVIAGSMMPSLLCALGGTLVSLIMVIAALILVSTNMHDVLVPFGAAEIISLIAFTSGYVVYKNVLSHRERRSEEVQD